METEQSSQYEVIQYYLYSGGGHVGVIDCRVSPLCGERWSIVTVKPDHKQTGKKNLKSLVCTKC